MQRRRRGGATAPREHLRLSAAPPLARRYGVIPDPDITEHELDDDDVFLVLASDGVWEFLDDATVVAMCEHWLKHYEDSDRQVEDAAAEVIQEAMQIWALEEDGGYRDDISIIIVLLPCWGP